MDFNKTLTSFWVDWFTPRDKHHPFPKSADDHVSQTRLSVCFTPVEEPIGRRHPYSIDRTSSCRAPSVPPDPEPEPMQDDAEVQEEYVVDEPPRSPGLLSVAGDCASCGVDVNVACLDNLDEMLLLSPVQCFTDMCWESAVDDKSRPPAGRRKTRTRSRSFNGIDRPLPSPSFTKGSKDYTRSFDRPRPLAAKISLPLPTSPHAPSSPYTESSHDTLSTFQDHPPLSYVLYTDSDGSPLALPLSHGNNSLDIPRRKGKRSSRKIPPPLMYIPPPPPPPPRAPSKSNSPLRLISDAYSTLVRARKKATQ